jgi:hypothetical protein
MRGYCGSFDDENYPKRLQDKFGNRWNIKVLVQVRRDAQENERGKLTERAEKYMGVRTITEPAVDIRKEKPPRPTILSSYSRRENPCSRGRYTSRCPAVSHGPCGSI